MFTSRKGAEGNLCRIMDIWSGNNILINNEYQKLNYRIIDVSDKSNLCLIFFSSHDIYYPNTETSFISSISIKNRYEWINTACNSLIMSQAGRIIFVRDIYKQYYITGINNDTSTITQIMDFLRKKTEGYRVITFGSSAGGYMAMAAGISLKAEYIINNSGDFNIDKLLHLESKFISAAYVNKENAPYTDLRKLLEKNEVPIYYFTAARNMLEKEQYEYVKGINCIKCIRFSEKNHASTVFPGNWAYLILNRAKLDSLVKERGMNNKIVVLFQTVPLKNALYIFAHEIKNFIKRRLKL